MESRSSTESVPSVSAIFGSSVSMSHVRELAQHAALVHSPVFIHGPTGSGKEVLARYLHLISPWNRGPFLKIHCPTEPELLETELFGFDKGAFPGASANKPGLLELASEGTLLLDDISELDLRLQEKLLRVLREGTFTSIGGQRPRSTHVRIMSTANRTLETAVEAGQFRQDLFERLAAISLGMPPLRERIGDLPAIARYMLSHFAEMLGSPVRPLPSAAMRRLVSYQWPGNIRELENVLFQYALTKASLAPLPSLALPTGQGESAGSLAVSAELKQRRSKKMLQPGAAGNSFHGAPERQR